MFKKLWANLSGYKTYILAAVGVAIALVGHFFGPAQIATIKIPSIDLPSVWNISWVASLFAALRNGMEKTS